ncbi:MAG: VCBS repeat-containing protein [Acidobacteria bacterium]|nr:VCBS repeat-containing protein [Acidobacteriota bacterium]
MKSKFILKAFLAIAALTTSALGVTINETIDTTAPAANPSYRAVTGQQTGRLSRNTIVSTCGTAKTNPGSGAATELRQYDDYRFVALGSGCLTVTLSNAGDNVLFGVAYDQTGLNPANPTANYLADMGLSPTSAVPSRTFSFDVTAGEIFHIVIHEVNAGGAIGQTYTLDVGGVKIVPDFSVTEIIDTTSAQQNPAYTAATGPQTGRLNRFPPASDCSGLKANPGLFTTMGTRQVDLYSFTPASSGCARVTLSHTGADSVHIVAYNQSGYVPTNPSTNYLADSGASATNNSVTFSFLVTRGVRFYIVVSEVNPGAGIGDSYTLNISNIRVAPLIRVTSTLDATSPSTNPDFTAATGVQTGRINRLPPPSDCNALKTAPGLSSPTGSRDYDVYTFTPARPGCVEVTLKSLGGPLLYAAAYSNLGFNPANPALNFVADGGTSPTLGNPESFSFLVSAGVPFSIVVHEVDVGAVGQSYSLEVEGIAMNATTRAAMFDFDGDRRTDPSIFRPSVGEWWYIRSSDGGNNAFQFGAATDMLAPADFTGDGKTDIAFFRPSTGFWYVLRSENTTFYSFPFGLAGDIPAPGDFDGDGRDDAAVFRPTNSTWYIQNSGGGTTILGFGLPGDLPVPADYDGDNKADIAVFRPTLGQWWLRRSNQGLIVQNFGTSSDRTVPADYTGDGRADVAIFRPSLNSWYVLRSEDSSYYSFPFGASGDVPVPGDYDGDGLADAVVYRPSTRTWYKQQTTNGFEAINFGAASDLPVPNAYVR